MSSQKEPKDASREVRHAHAYWRCYHRQALKESLYRLRCAQRAWMIKEEQTDFAPEMTAVVKGITRRIRQLQDRLY